jgi:hypothetical protein
MAVLKRDLYRQVKGPEVTHADRCAVVQSKSLGIPASAPVQAG